MKKTIETIVPGESLLVAVKAVKNNKVQIQLASFASRNGVNVASLLNKGDERFSSGNKPRSAWQTAEPAMVKALFGIDCSALAEGAVQEVNILNPSITDEVGKKHQLFVQVREYKESELQDIIARKAEAGQKTESLQYLLDNAETTAKINPVTKDQVLVDGELVFSTTRIVTGAPEHKWVVAEEVATVAVATAPAVDFNKID